MAPNKKFVKLALLTEFLSSSDSSSDEEMFLINREKKTRILDFANVIRKYSDEEFREHFRLRRSTCDHLIDKLKNSRLYKDLMNVNRGKPVVSPEGHIYSFLWFAVNKSTFREVCLLFNISVSTFDLICERVMKYLLEIGPEIIKFPKTENELQIIAKDFQNISGIPNIIGCIDGTYINIRTPANKIRSTYANRHHLTAITLQGICDSKKRFIDVFTGVPSKIHDARVYQLSFISKIIPEICGYQYHLLGDSAYSLSVNLITPFRDYGNLTAAQSNFNRKFSASRVLIENSFGLLKGRFRQLLHLDFKSVLRSSKFIISCCILHNMCITVNDVWDSDEVEVVGSDNGNDDHQQQAQESRQLSLQLGELKRNELCANLSM